MDSKERFTSRVDDYVKYRPSYPPEAIDYMYDVIGLRKGGEVADIGAGTGIFSRLLLERGSRVIAVEPNEAMREAALNVLTEEPNFRAVAGSAEKTGLPDESVDFIVCAQAFHWFDRSAARREFRRILRPGGRAILVWNSRLTEGTPFLEAYEQLLHTFGIDYIAVHHRNITPDELRSFFSGAMNEARFVNRTSLDYEQLRGRLLSSSYVPQPGHGRYEPMLSELRHLFDRCSSNGTVDFDYETEVYWGEV